MLGFMLIFGLLFGCAIAISHLLTAWLVVGGWSMLLSAIAGALAFVLIGAVALVAIGWAFRLGGSGRG